MNKKFTEMEKIIQSKYFYKVLIRFIPLLSGSTIVALNESLLIAKKKIHFNFRKRIEEALENLRPIMNKFNNN